MTGLVTHRDTDYFFVQLTVNGLLLEKKQIAVIFHMHVFLLVKIFVYP